MYPIDFQKETAERWLEAIQSGKPIVPPDGRWSVKSLIALAGLGFFGAMSHGPLSLKGIPGAWENLPEEYQEAHEDTLFHDLHATLEFYARLMMEVKDQTFDYRFEPHVQAVTVQKEGQSQIVAVKGFRGKVSDAFDDES
jgi:hypothetical protein